MICEPDKRKKRILIINFLKFHHEMFGYIIDFCKSFNYDLDILTVKNDMGMLQWYSDFFNNSFNYINTINFENIKNNYFKVFLTTDDDFNNYVNNINDVNGFFYNNTICINHAYVLRNLYFNSNNYIQTRYFKYFNNPYAYQVYNIISYK